MWSWRKGVVVGIEMEVFLMPRRPLQRTVLLAPKKKRFSISFQMVEIDPIELR